MYMYKWYSPIYAGPSGWGRLLKLLKRPTVWSTSAGTGVSSPPPRLPLPGLGPTSSPTRLYLDLQVCMGGRARPSDTLMRAVQLTAGCTPSKAAKSMPFRARGRGVREVGVQVGTKWPRAPPHGMANRTERHLIVLIAARSP